MRWKEMSYNKTKKKRKILKDYEYFDDKSDENYGLNENIYDDCTYSVEEVFDIDKYNQDWN